VPLIDRLDAVVFDVGKVLYEWDLRHLYRKLIPDPVRLEWFVTTVVTPEWHFQHDAGRPTLETVAELIACYPAERELIEVFVPRWLETIPGPVPGMATLVDDIIARGTKLFAITNFGAEFWPAFRANAPMFRYFDDVLVSGEEKLIKPDPAIFTAAIARFDIDPTRALFVDDLAANVAAARNQGFLTHHFRGEPELRATLFDGANCDGTAGLPETLATLG